MKKKQTDRLSKQHVKSKGAKGIFGVSAHQHDNLVKAVSKLAFESLKLLISVAAAGGAGMPRTRFPVRHNANTATAAEKPRF